MKELPAGMKNQAEVDQLMRDIEALRVEAESSEDAAAPVRTRNAVKGVNTPSGRLPETDAPSRGALPPRLPTGGR
jgi:hypothetical protein